MLNRCAINLLAAFALLQANAFSDEESRPNIIVILVDDMGFSDIGSYGGEIATPNLDRLAEGGVKFSNFYNSARCCPTRASLMTGLYPHEAGIGNMTNYTSRQRFDKGPEYPGYRGHLNRASMTIAEVLREAGYATLMAGKWHLGIAEEDRWPLQRGFGRYYGCLSGAFSFFEPSVIKLDNETVSELGSTTDRRYYTTDAFTDYAIRFVDEEHRAKDRPFFLYLAYNAPHWPLHAHEEDVQNYVGKYMQGWDRLRAERLERQKRSGLIDTDLELSQRPDHIPSWESLSPEKQQEMDLRMAYYAAMVDRVDQNIGKLARHLEETGQFENTLILFLSDNGACDEGGVLGGKANPFDRKEWDRDIRHRGSYGAVWANASNTPFRKAKKSAHEGGAATPFIAHWPAQIAPMDAWYRETASIIDIAPTLYELAGAEYPSAYKGNRIAALRGVSLTPAFAGKPLERQAPLLIEHIGNAALIAGDRKLVGEKIVRSDGVDSRKWELYNLAEDRGEEDNLAAEMPELVRSMEQQWLELARGGKIYPRPPKEKKPSKK